MTAFVVVLGAIMLGFGLALLVAPGFLRRGFGIIVRPSTLPLFAILRIGFGIALVLASADTRLPVFVWAFGLLLIIAGVSLPLFGIRRLMKWAERWKAKPDGVIRGWALLAILLGALLTWAAI